MPVLQSTSGRHHSMNFATSFFIGHHAHPLLFATCFLIIGITVAFCEIPFTATVLLFLISLFPILIAYARAYIFDYKWILLPMCFLVGVTLYQKQVATHHAFQEKYNGIPVVICGTVASVEKIQNTRHRWHLIIDLHEIKTPESNIATTESVAIYSVYNPLVQVGDIIQIKNVTFKKIENNSFNFYLAKEKIAATLFVDKPNITILEHPLWSLNRFIAQLRNRVFIQLQHAIDKQTFSLFSSIFLGNRAAVKQYMDKEKEPFKYWGTSHYLARSGLHLVIFGLIWHFILGFLPLLFFWKQVCLILLIGCYALLSWSSVSFNRALIMFFIAKFCLLAQNRLHYVHLITLATCLVLCLNPLQLFFLDFQLSFGLTFALAWFTHIQQHKKLSLIKSIV